MKQKFSTKWKSSKQPRKQRKYLANAPLHIKRKLLSVNLSKELRKKYEKRNIVIKKGDIAKIMRGKFKGKKGKVTTIRTKNLAVNIEGIQVKKRDGSKVNVKLQPSNLQIIELNLEDKKRMKITEIKKKKKVKQGTKSLTLSKQSENSSMKEEKK